MMSVQLAMGEKNNQKKGKEEHTERSTNQASTIYFSLFFFSWLSLEKIYLLSLEKKRIKRFYSNSSK